MRRIAAFALGFLASVFIINSSSAQGKMGEGLSLTLNLNAERFDPEVPRSVPVEVVVTNRSQNDQSVYAPEVHDGLSFRARSHVDTYRTHPMWLTTARLSQSEARPIVLKPNESRVIFRTNLADILPSGAKSSWRTFTPTRWSWTWGAKPHPPSSPIVPTKPNFPEIKKVTFWAQLGRRHDSPRSNEVTIDIGSQEK